MIVFRRLLANALVGGVMSSFLWFALTFWTYLETRSVIATSVIGGAYAVASALFGMVFGTFVDRHRKHTAMVVASVSSLACFAVATVVYAIAPADDVHRLGAPWFWLLVALVLAGSVVLVMIVELLNTAIESALDRVGLQWHDLTKRAKDLGSAAVLLALLLCLATWAMALWSRFG